jgi:hypothetical protein
MGLDQQIFGSKHVFFLHLFDSSPLAEMVGNDGEWEYHGRIGGIISAPNGTKFWLGALGQWHKARQIEWYELCLYT